jgi:hypothetical protein
MSNGTFTMVLACGAALLALWLDARFPALAPHGLNRLFAHTAVALLLMQIVPGAGGSIAFAFAVVFAVALPVFVYGFLVAIWGVRLLQGVAGAPR